MTGTSDPPLVHLHIGTMKSGTSYLQEILGLRQSELAERGVRYPGVTGPAVNDLLGRSGTPGQGPIANAWAGLVADVRAWAGSSVIISMEFLGLATPTQIAKLVDDLQPGRLHVVLTVRDIGRTLPSAWQQTTKNRGTMTWPDFLAAVMSAADDMGAPEQPAAPTVETALQFWRHHDVVRVAQRWADVVGAGAMTVVTVPRPGSPPELLWERFARATGIDTARISPAGAGRGNPSLGLPQAELLRRLNGRIGGNLDPAPYRRIVTGVMARRVLRTPAGDTRVPPLPETAAAWARQHGETVRAALEALGVRVVGDLSDLVPDPADLAAGTGSSASVSDADLAATTVSAAAALVVEIADVQAQRRRGQTSH